ncbi:hypothetical protein D3C72_1942380 [compost metagenome]
MRLVFLAAHEVGIFIGFEVRQAHNHPLRPECRPQRGNPFSQAAHIELDRVVVALHQRLDFLLQFWSLLIKLQQCPRMHANHAVDDKFQPGQAHAFVRQARKVKGAVGVTDVHHDFQRQ